MKKPFFSIVIAVKDGVDSAVPLLSSLCSQSSQDFEVLIKSNASGDNRDFLLGYPFSCKLILGDDAGIYDAWNQALSHAEGEFIIFLGVDDFPDGNDAIFQYIRCITKSKKKIIYNDIKVVDESGVKFFLEPGEWCEEKKVFRQEMRFGHTGLAVSRDVFAKVGEFNPNFKVAGDYDFMCRCFECCENEFHYSGECFFKMGYGGMSTNGKTKIIGYLECLKIAKKRNNVISLRLAMRVFKAVVRHYVS